MHQRPGILSAAALSGCVPLLAVACDIAEFRTHHAGYKKEKSCFPLSDQLEA